MDPSRIARQRAAPATGAVSRRRFAVLGLAGLAAGQLAMLAPAAAPAAARPRRRRPKPAICKPGDLVAQVLVPATGAEVLSPRLARKQTYTVMVTGAASVSATHNVDACAFYPASDPLTPQFAYQGQRVGLSMDGGSPEMWAPYSPNHRYAYMVNGRNKRLSFQLNDPVSADNSGHLVVNIICGQAEE